MAKDIFHVVTELRPAPGDFAVIATQHKGDHLSSKRALASGVGSIALIASRRRSRLVLDYLRREGMGEPAARRNGVANA
jgi:xanthine dehydrogenase accessory factor